MKPVMIYALRCPTTNEIRYVGKAVNVKARYSKHIYYARAGAVQHSSRWVKTLLDQGLYPTVEVLMTVPAGEAWQPHEKRLIAEALALGCLLTNITPGGDGGHDYINEADRERRRVAIQAWSTPEVIARRTESIRAAWADPIKRAAIVAKQKAAAAKPERRAELSKAALKRTHDGEARRLAAVNEYWADPENRAKQATRMVAVGKANRQPKTHI